MCFSSGSKTCWKVCLYRKNHNYYAGGFTGILRNKNKKSKYEIFICNTFINKYAKYN